MKSRLKEYREKVGLTQKQLADEAGIAASQVSKLEGENPNPTMLTACKLACALNVSLSVLFEYE